MVSYPCFPAGGCVYSEVIVHENNRKKDHLMEQINGLKGEVDEWRDAWWLMQDLVGKEEARLMDASVPVLRLLLSTRWGLRLS